jgi:hypothetical protein
VRARGFFHSRAIVNIIYTELLNPDLRTSFVEDSDRGSRRKVADCKLKPKDSIYNAEQQ